MNLMILRTLAERYDGGLKRLSQDIGMSEANLHRCINNNKIQAGDLEHIAIALNVDVRVFFDSAAIKNDSRQAVGENENLLLQLCKSLVANYQQRDEVMGKLVSMVEEME
jgi:DNA-binding Xre family transcriptional regulator